jgi:hypothetical protein
MGARRKWRQTHEHEGRLSRCLPEQQGESAPAGLYAISKEERRAKDVEGLAALKAWDERHQDAIVYMGGPLGPTKRTSRDGVADVVNELTVFVVVRASSHEEAAKMFEGHPHFTIFPCDAVDVMPLLSGPDAQARTSSVP